MLFDVDTLVDLAITTRKSFNNEWLTNVLLKRIRVLVEGSDPDAYILISRRARKEVTDLPVMAMRFDINTLVDLAITTAKDDKTKPYRKDLRKGWLTDAILKCIDALVAGKYNNPAAYAKIGRRVLAEVGDMPKMALAKLAILRGERLLPLTPEQVRIIIDISEDLRTFISALSDGTRKKRCQELFLYNMGIFYDASGRFDEAAKTQEWAAREAGEGSSSAAISLYCAASSWLKYALLVGRFDDELEALFFELEVKYQELAKALHGSELYAQWVEGNCPIQMIMACVWLDCSHSEWDKWVEMAMVAPDKLGEAWRTGAEFVRAADFSARHIHPDSEAEMILMTVAENSAESPETKATALLMLARRSTSLREARGFVDEMPVKGAQHVRAIAERMLSKLYTK